MSYQKQSYITVEECVNTYLDRSEQGISKFYKCWNIAFDGMTQLGLDFFFQIRSKKLPINGNKTVNLPDDYLNYCKIGIFNDRGEVIPLKHNDKMTTFADMLPDRKAKTEDNTIFDWNQVNSPIFYNFWNGYNVTNLYGIPSGEPFVGDFKIDPTAGIILLSEWFCYDYICLEYVASPNLKKDEYYIPVQFKEALVWYIAWMDLAFLPTSRRGGLGDKEQRKRNYYNERRLANARWRPLYLNEAYEWNLTNQRLCVKA